MKFDPSVTFETLSCHCAYDVIIDVTADDNDDMTKHATSDLTDYIATDVAAEDAVDNLFNDAVSDVSSVISTVSVEYVPNNTLPIETGSLRSHRAQSIEAADESFLRNQGNYLIYHRYQCFVYFAIFRYFSGFFIHNMYMYIRICKMPL